MRSAALRVQREDHAEAYPQTRLNEFAHELSELCRRYGIGITGKPTLFVMEPPDASLSYAVDEDSNLILT